MQKTRLVRVYVHVAYGFDRRAWERRWSNGSLIGMNDQTPYGYGRAESEDLHLTFSEDAPEQAPGKLARLALRAVLGFDLVHAWRNRRHLDEADVIWTHTESQFLAIALLRILAARKPKAKLLGQSVWLFDQWRNLSKLRRHFYRRLIREVDVLTVHSPDNLAIAKSVFPDKWIELVLFGIATERRREPRARTGDVVRVLGLGNDVHRDWATAIEAFGDHPAVELTIVSSRAKRKHVEGRRNVRIITVGNNEDLFGEFDSASILIVPLKRNHHASGITVLQEGALCGVPCVASDVGGLKAYFDETCVTYVPEGDPAALREAVLALASDPLRARRQAVAAQNRMGGMGLGVDSYVARHVELTHRLLQTS